MALLCTFFDNLMFLACNNGSKAIMYLCNNSSIAMFSWALSCLSIDVKCSIFSTKLKSLLLLLLAIFNSLFCLVLKVLSVINCSNGAVIKVSGVRSSCEILANKFCFWISRLFTSAVRSAILFSSSFWATFERFTRIL